MIEKSEVIPGSWTTSMPTDIGWLLSAMANALELGRSLLRLQQADALLVSIYPLPP